MPISNEIFQIMRDEIVYQDPKLLKLK